MPRIRRGGGRLRAGGGRTRNEDCCCEETDDYTPCTDLVGTSEFMALYDAEVKFEGGTWEEDDACCAAFFAGPFSMSDDGTSNCQIWESGVTLPCGMSAAAGMAIRFGMVCTGTGSERHLRLNMFGCYSVNKGADAGGDIGWLAQWPNYDFPPTITIGQWYDLGAPDSITGVITECRPDSGDPPHMFVRFV